MPGPDVVYHGAASDLVAGPGLEIVGTVRDKDTGKPLAGITVQTTMPFGNPFRFFKTTTDAGAITGSRGCPEDTSSARARSSWPARRTGRPTCRRSSTSATHPGPASVRKDFALKRGAWARGRVIDRSTGKPVPAELNYFILEDNPHLKDYPGYGTLRFLRPFHTDENGEFQIAVIPGRGILGAGPTVPTGWESGSKTSRAGLAGARCRRCAP